jgi:hypothetical protein
LIRKLVLGSILALALGVLIGMPVLFKTITFGEPPKIYADVVYAYFSLLPSNQSVPGLPHEQFVSFLFILNVTNLSNEVVEITRAQGAAAPQMEFIPAMSEGSKLGNKTSYIYPNETVPSNVEWSNATQVRYAIIGESVAYGFTNQIASSSENYEGSQYYWNENASRLLALSGVLELPPWGLATMQNAKIFLFSHVEGKVYSNGVAAYGAYVIKGVQLENFGDREFVFNELLKGNGTLHLDLNGVPITSGN